MNTQEMEDQIELEVRARYREEFRRRVGDCPRCQGEPYIPVRKNYPNREMPPAFEAMARDADSDAISSRGVLMRVPCALCVPKMGGMRIGQIHIEVSEAWRRRT